MRKIDKVIKNNQPLIAIKGRGIAAAVDTEVSGESSDTVLLKDVRSF